MSMTRADVERIVRDARANGTVPNLRGANLSGLNLGRLDLRWANLRHANLYGANLYGADLSHAKLHGADLSHAKLYGANLYGATLHGATLHDADWDGLQLDGLPSGQLNLTPTPVGWQLQVGCWGGTVDKLEALALSDDEDDWPDARGHEIAHRRPLLLAAINLCRAHIDANPTIIADLAERWGTSKES